MIGERLDRWLRAHPSLVDGAVAGLLTFVLVAAYAAAGTPWEAVLAAGMLLPLAWRRTHPVVMVALVTGFSLAAWAVMDTLPPASVAVPAAVYAARVYGPRWLGLAVLPLAVLGAVLEAAKNGGDAVTSVVFFVGMAAVVLAAWSFASLSRIRREQVLALRERTRLLEVEREQQAALAAAAERARIAREMHDVVAHSLAIVVAQADGGRYAARADPAAADRALSTVADTARGALADMRRLLGVLRDGDEAPPADEARAPQPGLDGLPALAERIRSGGVPVRLTVSGTPRPAPDGLGLAAYRIAQEGLTNVLKHAGPGAAAELSVRWTDRALEVDVLDDGRGSGADPADGTGHGLVGMRERAAIFGGSLDARPRPGGGFALRAVLPL